MPNAVLTAKNAPGVTAKLVAMNLRERAKFIKSIDKEDEATWSAQFESANPGDTIYIKKPARFITGTNLDITSTMQDIKEEKVALTLDTLRNVAFKMTSLETAYDRPIKYWNDNFVAPAVNALAAELERTMLNKACLAVSNLVGTDGTPPGAILDFLTANERIYQNLAPEDDRMLALINPATNTKTVDARKGLFQSSERIKEQYENGYIGLGEGFNYLRSNLLPTFTTGTATGAITVTTTSVNGATTIALTGTGTQTLVAGQVFTVAGVYDVHPLTKQTQANLKQFVITANNTAAGGLYTGVQISPTIYDAATGGSLQNVSALPTATNVVTLWNTTTSTGDAQNLCYHPSAFRFVSVPLYTPKNRDFAAQETVDGISVRALRDFDIRTSESIMRFDVLCGLAAVRSEWACRVA
jgi:hypothetical protein